MPTSYDELVALTATEYTKLSELIGKLNGEDSPIAKLTYEYQLEQTLAKTLPVSVASGRFEDEGVFLEPWEYNKNSHLTDLDSGAKYYKVGTYTRKDIIGSRASAIGINEKQYQAQGALGKWWRAQQIYDRVHKMGLDIEHDMIYGDPRQDTRSFLGLAPRFSILTDLDGVVLDGEHKGEKSPYITIDAGGTTSGKLSSIYLIYPHQTNGVTWLIPNEKTNITGGIEYKQGQFHDITRQAADGGIEALYEATDIFTVYGGIGMRNRQSCIRIANVDCSTADGLKKLRHALREATEAVSPSISAGFYGYCSKRTKIAIMDALSDKVVPITFANSADAPKTAQNREIILDGQRLQTLTHLLDTEDKVV